MLNTRYIIQPDDQNRPTVVPNGRACDNAWFVEKVKMVKNADEELNALSDFDPETTAIIDERFANYLEDFTPEFDSLAQIDLIDYKPNHLQYQSSTQKVQLVVFSEIYYDKGWNAYIDDHLMPHFRVNYVLRAMLVPAGEHKIDFKFEPKVYRVGEKISFASSLLVILLVIGYGVFEIRNYFKKEK
jgi:hypothetical protein